MKKTVKFIAAIIENDQNEILCAMRSPEMSISNMWEFPGGKVEPNEDLFESLTSEIKEELHCEIEPNELHNDIIHEYETFITNLIAYAESLMVSHFLPSIQN